MQKSNLRIKYQNEDFMINRIVSLDYGKIVIFTDRGDFEIRGENENGDDFIDTLLTAGRK